jgi:hypothetical protein
MLDRKLAQPILVFHKSGNSVSMEGNDSAGLISLGLAAKKNRNNREVKYLSII